MNTPDDSAASSAEEWLKLAGGAQVVRLAAGITLAGTLFFILLLPELRSLDDRRLIGPAVLIPISLGALLQLHFGKAVAAYLTLLWGALLAITLSCLMVAGLRTALAFAYPAAIMGGTGLGPRAVLGT